MARSTLEATLARRAQVEQHELHGLSARAIAAELGADPRTVGRDLRALAAHRARHTDVAAARQRLLAAAQTVEAAAWALHDRLSLDAASLQLGALGKALAAQERQASLLGAIETATLAAEVAELRAQVAALLAERPGLRRVGSS